MLTQNLHIQSKSWKISFFAYFILVNLLLNDVEARSKRKVKSGLKNVGERPGEQSMMKALVIIKNTFLIALAPVIFMFLYSIITDPITPRIVKSLWKKIKEGFLSTLGNDASNDNNYSSKKQE